MKQKTITILCALALIAGGLGHAYATEDDEPMLPVGVEQVLSLIHISEPTRRP